MGTILCCIAAIGLHIGSAHVAPYPDAPRLRGFNPGAYVEFTNHVVAGAFRNSIGRSSAYLAYNIEFDPIGQVVPSLVIGAITGYAGGHARPLILPTIRAPLSSNVSLRLAYLPKMPATLAHVLHLSFEYRF